jgi:hypothetical protein
MTAHCQRLNEPASLPTGGSDAPGNSSETSAAPVTTGPHRHTRASPRLALDAGPVTRLRCRPRRTPASVSARPDMGGAGRRAAIPLIRTVPCRPRKIGCCSSWSTSSSILRNCCMGACSGGTSPRRHNGFMSYCPCYAMPCAVWALRPVGVCKPGVTAWGWQEHPCRWRPHRQTRSQAPHPQRPPLVVMTAPSDPSRAPTTRRHRNRARAARKSGTC